MKSDLKLVLIYLGREVPSYVLDNANRLANMFSMDVYLFTESVTKFPLEIEVNEKLKICQIRELDDSEQLVLNHDAKFRNGFWIHTFNRLLYLRDIHKSIGGKSRILHVEGDLLIMPSFPFEEALGSKLKWFEYSELSDVASLVYSPDLEATNWLYSSLMEEMKLDSQVTDMSALKRIRMKYPNRIETFPDIFSDSTDRKSEDIFDGLSLGEWLCGVDSRNTFGWQFLHENSEFRRAKSSSLREILQDSQFCIGDKGSLVLKSGESIREIHSLHIHSKDRKLFVASNFEAIQYYLDRARHTEAMVIGFSLSLFIRLVKENIYSGTTVPYFRNFLRFLLKRDQLSKFRLLSILKYITRGSAIK